MSTDEHVVIAMPGSIKYLDPYTLETVIEYELGEFGISSNYVQMMKGTNEKIHLVGVGNNSHEIIDYYILDLSKSSILKHYSNPDTIDQIDLSKDGKYILINNSLYINQNGIISFHKNLNMDLSDYEKAFSETGNLILFNSDELKYLSCLDLNTNYEYSFESPISTYGRFVDKNRFLYYSDCYLTVIDLELKEIIYKGPVNSTYEFSEYFLTDKNIYSNDGFRFPYIQ
jgi:hypothetical protein